MDVLESVHEMRIEWQAWQDVVHEFAALGLDINQSKHNQLVRAICLWGERLHGLRAVQADSVVESALQDNMRRYERS